MNPFHLAIQVRDIEEARRFYISILGCKEGRSADSWVDFDFYGHQLARGIGLLLSIGTLVLLWLAYRRLSPDDNAPLVLAFLFILLAPGFHVFATAGLEGPLLSFLLVGGIVLTLRGSRLTAAAVFGLAGITRPEGPLLALLWLLATIRPRPSIAEIVKKELPAFAAMVAPILCWQVFRLAYYGAWIPNTALAKAPGVFAEFISLPDYAAPWIIALGGPALLLLWFVLPPREEPIRNLERMCLAVVGGMTVFVIYAGGDWMTFGRFIEPVWPVIALVFPLWLSDAWKHTASTASLRFRKILPAVPALAIIGCSVIAWYPSVGSYVRNERMTMLMRGTDQIAVGDWIARNIAPEATIATGRLGGISYAAMNNVVWDWFGLTDAEEAKYIRRRRPGDLEDDPVFSRKPDVIAAIDAPAQWSYRRTIPFVKYLDSNYVFMMSFPQGRYGSVDLWLRKDRIDQILLTRSSFVLPPASKKP